MEDPLPDPSLRGPASAPARTDVVGLVGFGVMGRGLATNLLRNGVQVVATDPAIDPATPPHSGPPSGGSPEAHDTVRFVRGLQDLAGALPRPRSIILMVPAGDTVDAVLTELTTVLDAGDVLIDGGNSHPSDTSRRTAALATHRIHLIGAGISGGEAGAAAGPSIMPGGDLAGWEIAGELLRTIAAVGPDGAPCCDWIGPGGAGHLAKTVHNGIEYALMQGIAELIWLLRADGASVDDVALLLQDLRGDLVDGFLLTIAGDILTTRDADGAPLLDAVLDVTSMKGTGSWATALALELGRPVATIAAAVQARARSTDLEGRVRFARLVTSERPRPGVAASADGDGRSVTQSDVRDALLAVMLIAFAEGLDLLASAAAVEGWRPDLARIVGLWRAGSIVQTDLLEPIGDAYRTDPDLPTLLVDPTVVGLLDATAPALRRCVIAGAQHGVAAPVMTAALATFDSMRVTSGTGSMIQALRDRFGAHTFERRDRPRGERFHDTWGT